MEISFSNKLTSISSSLLIVLTNGKEILNDNNLSDELKIFISEFLTSKNFEKRKTFNESTYYKLSKKTFLRIFFVKAKINENSSYFENLGGQAHRMLEYDNNIHAALILESFESKNINYNQTLALIASGFNLKNYSFRKFRTDVRPIRNSIDKINFISREPVKVKKEYQELKCIAEGVFLTRDLVSEPANVLYPEQFVKNCKKLEKAGLKLEIFDEKKISSLKMNALLGVAQGSVRPPRVLVMKWKGGKNKNPLAFVGKGVTFDTGGISIKPSGGMEDMKWDMGGAGVVAGLMYSLALRKANVNAIGIVGLVENMPDGNAQRPGDIVKSMSGQTIEVLNTDAEGRLVLADILWYINQTYKPEIIIDLATLTGAIIVALGDLYAGLFSNNDKLANNLLDVSKSMKENLWRLPLDEGFDKLLNCDVADMKNITGTRGAGSITAAQFLKRFVGDTKWAHLDIAGVTWSRKGTNLSRPGGTGFGVRLLDKFVKKFYE